ncbi:hypothetical protein FGO68_gene6460 [Halteria grandinella]|uniref:KOW domain-containing protein n=1 Tax=Halteria grandinella TaxID=5974 RepID=A0A8J8NBS9_HALGN|nr:hypothetical protein FGO68_gene6460 [Halteria grandinella]
MLKSEKTILYGERATKRSRSRSPKKEAKDLKKLKWVLPNIIIRCISKKVADGKLYNRKLRITDVPSAYQFLASPIEGENVVYECLREKDVETVIPKDGGEVAVLKGEYKGEVGKVIGRDKKKERVTVQVGMMDIIEVSLDDCCSVYK